MTIISKYEYSIINLNDLLPFDFNKSVTSVIISLHTLAQIINNRNELNNILSESELETFKQLKSLKRQTEWIGGRLAAKRALKNSYNEYEMNSIITGYKDNGIPYIKNPDKNINLSISHSGNYAAAVISELPVAIDIEEIKTEENNSMLYLFNDEEKEHIKNISDGFSKYEYITRLWSAKESVIKILHYLSEKSINIDPQDIYLTENTLIDYKSSDIMKQMKHYKSYIKKKLPGINTFGQLNQISIFSFRKEIYIITLAICS